MGNGQIRRHIWDANLARKNYRNVMLFWRYTDYICSKPISMVMLNSYFVMPKCIISEYITQNNIHSVTKWYAPLRNCNGVVATE